MCISNQEAEVLQGKFSEIKTLCIELLKRDLRSWLINSPHAGNPLFSAFIAEEKLCPHMKDKVLTFTFSVTNIRG